MQLQLGLCLGLDWGDYSAPPSLVLRDQFVVDRRKGNAGEMMGKGG